VSGPDARAGDGSGGGVLLSPSLLSADWTRLPEQIALAEQGADWLHLDVMDGQFVPNLTFGPFIVKAIRRLTKLPLDVHLMIHDPVDYAQAFRDAGADWLSFHVEARGAAGPGWPAPVRSSGEGARGGADPGGGAPAAPPAAHAIDLAVLRGALAAFRRTGARVGIALRPDTAVAEIEPVLGELDLLLPMSVYPGFSAQAFCESALAQLRRAAQWRAAHGAGLLLQTDGGVAPDTIARIAAAGADVFVAGSAVYGRPDPLAAMRELRARARAARPAGPATAG
jgi:ribulose-phosphate 3-epimerase